MYLPYIVGVGLVSTLYCRGRSCTYPNHRNTFDRLRRCTTSAVEKPRLPRGCMTGAVGPYGWQDDLTQKPRLPRETTSIEGRPALIRFIRDSDNICPHSLYRYTFNPLVGAVFLPRRTPNPLVGAVFLPRQTYNPLVGAVFLPRRTPNPLVGAVFLPRRTPNPLVGAVFLPRRTPNPIGSRACPITWDPRFPHNAKRTIP